MNLEQRVNEDIKASLKAGDKIRLQTLRSIRSLILEFQKSGKNQEFNEEEEVKLLNKAAKNRKEAIAMYLQAGRTELAENEKRELEIITEFLPAQLSEEEIHELILSIISKLNAKGMQDMGKVMGATMKEVSGKADGNTVQQIVRKILKNYEA